MPPRSLHSFVALLLALALAPAAWAQDADADLRVVVEPAEVTLSLGETIPLTARVVDADGNEQSGPLMFFSRSRRAVEVRRDGTVRALQPGTYEVFVGRGRDLYAIVPVTVRYPAVESVTLAAPAQVYSGTRVALPVTVVDAAGAVRDNVEVTMESSDPSVATVDAFGHVTAHAPGTATITAKAEAVETTLALRVAENPTVRVALASGAAEARTGDVLAFEAAALDAAGNAVPDAPVTFTVQAQPADDLGPGASALIGPDGRFVAETPGLYTVVATSGNFTDAATVRIAPRDVRREATLVGKGIVSDVHTSDLWVWEGLDGRDYAVTGTWGANGEAYFWDVTDAANPALIDTVTVDARTVNDVKVNAAGDLCIISREGASSRKNGLVILDCSDPYDVTVITEFTENLTGGVHNLFIYEDHVFALSAGQRYDIITIEDPANPRRVGSFELDTPGHSIHDVWVEDGIAYSSNWRDGVYMVDVGNGIAGGTVENPVVIGHYAYPSGWNHAAFPYRNAETGKFYIIAGDEAFDAEGNAMGWVHFIDFTDPKNPQEVARYEVPEAGTHNLWVEDGTLYVAYYQGGLRVVDITGDLMGDLYRQGREIARYLPKDPGGKVANSPMAWGPQFFKGKVFVSDMNSGLWIIEIEGDDAEKQPGL